VLVRDNFPRTLLLLALMSLLVLAGCGDDDPAAPGDGGGDIDLLTGTISFTQDGAGITYDETAAGLVTNSVVTVTGGDDNSNDGIIIIFPDAPGTYACDGASGASITVSVGSAVYMTGATATGTITVTDVGTDAASGTFSGTLLNFLDGTTTVEIVDGSFDVPVIR